MSFNIALFFCRTSVNVEEQIKQSLLQEVTSLGSAFKNLKIDQETMDVKRLLDHEMLKTASFMREIDVSTHLHDSCYISLS